MMTVFDPMIRPCIARMWSLLARMRTGFLVGLLASGSGGAFAQGDDATYLYLCVVYPSDTARITAHALVRRNGIIIDADERSVGGDYRILMLELEKGTSYEVTFMRGGRTLCVDRAFRSLTGGNQVSLRQLDLEGRPSVKGREPQGKLLLRARVLEDIGRTGDAQVSIEGGDERARWSRPLEQLPTGLMMWYVTPGHRYTITCSVGDRRYIASDSVRMEDWSPEWTLSRITDPPPVPAPVPIDTCRWQDTLWSECVRGWRRGTVRGNCGQRTIKISCTALITPVQPIGRIINPSYAEKEACQNWYTTFTKDVPDTMHVGDVRSASITVDTLIRDAAFRPEVGDLLTDGRKAVFRLNRRVRIELVSLYGKVAVTSPDKDLDFSITGLDPIEFRFELSGKGTGADTLEVQAWTPDCGTEEMKRSPYNKLRIPIMVKAAPDAARAGRLSVFDLLLKYTKEISGAMVALLGVIGYIKGWFKRKVKPTQEKAAA